MWRCRKSFLTSRHLKYDVMQILDIKDYENILIIAPHPDDECIGAGGVLLRYSSRCSVLILTDGAIGQGEHCRIKEAALRKREFINEMKQLGISDYHFLDIPDGTLLNHADCLMQYDFSRFDYILVTGDKDEHPDHTGAYLAVKNALSNRGNGHRPRVFLYEVHKQLSEPTHWMDITGDIEKKKLLIRFHKSQTKVLPYDEMSMLNAGYRALQNRMPGKYIEVYQEVPDFDDEENNEIRGLEQKLQKHIQFYQLLVRWMKAKSRGGRIAKVLVENGIKKVSVYGYAELGQLLCTELASEAVEIDFVLDKNPAKRSEDGVRIVSPECGNRQTDAVIVTAVFYYSDIRDDLIQMGYKTVYSLSELIDWM